MTTDTPRTDAAMEIYGDRPFMVYAVPVEFAEGLERELAASKAEVERLTDRMKEAEDLIKGLHGGWKKAREAHLETCKDAQAEIDKLRLLNK